MKNTAMQTRLEDEIIDFISSRKTLNLASLNEDGTPYSSYAPFAIGDNCLFILISEIAIHGINLQKNRDISVLIVEDEQSAESIFARIRINYKMQAELLDYDSEQWHQGLEILQQRQGEMIKGLSQHSDFKLFKLIPVSGRYIKGFGKAYAFEGQSLNGLSMNHLRDGHIKRNNSRFE